MKNFINFLTFFRLFAGPVIFVLILILPYYEIALIIYFLASITDYFDGYLARKYELTTEFGAVMDPIADKILITFMICALSVHLSSPYIAFMGSIVLAREFWVSALRDLNARRGLSTVTAVSFLAKLKTAVQMLTFFFYLIGIAFNLKFVLFLSHIMILLAVILTIISGIQYTQSTFGSIKK